MNANNAAAFLLLVQALSEGKTIEYRRHDNLEWEDMDNVSFVGSPECYRIKPDEPIEFEGITQATSHCHNDDSGHIRLAVNWPCNPPKIGTKFRLTEII